MTRVFRAALAGVGLSALASAAFAQTAAPAPEPAAEEVQEVVVYGRGIDLVGEARSGSEGVVGYADFENRPLSRVGELVENVPGVIATQHSGTGKANQYFLRGFNLDHGTDFAGFVDGVPVNMRTHGHGQGYLDFNFLIPELVERIDYRKGPYFADVGDFSAAGTVAFTTLDRLDDNLLEASAGSFGYGRALAAGGVDAFGGHLLAGVEATVSDGPWVLDEELEKFNGLLKFSRGTAERGWSVGLSGYRAEWTSTDQVPERAIEQGLIDRFGFIDPDLGGETGRVALTGSLHAGPLQATAYAIRYNLTLTSNFTYFLEDPVGGDEFQQKDRRTVYGGALSRAFDLSLAGTPARLRLGGDVRIDRIDQVGLYRSQVARPTRTIRQDKVDERSLGLFADLELDLTDRLRGTLGVRGDAYDFDVEADLADNTGGGSDSIVTPKLGLAYQATDDLELYLNYGEGFHSNDVRGASIRIDPATGDPADRVPVLSRAKGAEVGLRYGGPELTVSAALFGLDLDSELVFVGDAGSTEASGATRRYGVEGTVFWRPTDRLTIDASAALTNARFRDVPDELERIPGAVDEVVGAGVIYDVGRGLTATLRVRHFGDAPLIEDNSERSRATTLVNAGVYYEIGPARLALDILNLFDTEAEDITYFYESQLPGEAEPVADRHIHPVEPLQVRATLRYAF